VRQWVTPRSLLLHLAFVLIASGCLIAGWWQVHRAMQGNTLSYLYSVEWPAFAVVAGIGWWQMFHDTPADIAARKAHHSRMREASREVVARTLPRSSLAITVGSEDAANGRVLGAAEVAATALGAGSEDPAAAALVLAAGPPAVRRAGSDPEERLLAAEPDTTDDLTEYNRYLALLAVRGKAKTWRNPRGVK
jgi:hypothetical protein